jgi:hypothetical protein
MLIIVTWETSHNRPVCQGCFLPHTPPANRILSLTIRSTKSDRRSGNNFSARPCRAIPKNCSFLAKFFLGSTIIESHSFWRKFGKGMIGKGIRKRLGHDDSPAVHSLATSGFAPEPDKRQKDGRQKNFLFLYFCPHLFAVAFSVALVAAHAKRLSMICSILLHCVFVALRLCVESDLLG